METKYSICIISYGNLCRKREQRVFLESAENEGRFVSFCCWQWPDDIWGLVAVGGMILLGIGMGMLMTMSILQFGFHGGLIGIGLMFPQFIIYVPCFFAVSKNVYEYSMRIWKNHSSFSGQVSTYIVKMLICAVVLCAGILSEVYCNPVIMKILIQNLKIF